MAGISKLKGNFSDYKAFVVWCLIHKPSLLKDIFFNPLNLPWTKPDEVRLIADFSYKQDRWLYWHCPLDFVRVYLRIQCGYEKENWFVRLFWKS